MPEDIKENLKERWEKQSGVAREAQRWGGLANAGFIGLVATQMPEFFSAHKGAKSTWRLPLFVASSASIVVGVVMNWVKGNKAEAMRESNLMIEHDRSAQWSAKIAAQQDNSQTIAK